MRAVNLIPADQRKGAGGAAGRAGGAVYVLVGTLAVLAVMSVLYAISANQASDRRSKLANVSAQADVVQSQATALQPYVTFAGIRQTREQAVASIAGSRFDWAAAMDQIARALPNDVTLSALTGGAAATPATAGPPLAPASGPAVTLTGCATGHDEVATVLVALRAIQGVTGVSLATSTRPNPTAPPTCPKGATFSTTLTYGPSAAETTTSPTTNGAAAATATSPTAGSTR